MPLQLAPITNSAPIFFTYSTGKFLNNPPSTSNIFPVSIGLNAVGIDILLLNANAKLPLSKTTGFPVTISTEMHLNGIGNLSKSLI